MTKTCDVAVIGAGLSGLTAAYQLRDTDVVVLEADDQIGGRSRRTELAGWPTTTGGEGWYDPNPDSPESRLLTEVGITTTPVPGTPLLHTADGRNITLSTPEQLADDLGFSPQARPDFLRTFTRVAEQCAALAQPPVEDLVRHLLGMSGVEWLGPVHEEVLLFYRRLVSTEIGISLDADSAFSMLTGMPAFGGASEVWGGFLVPDGGAPMIGRAMAARLGRKPWTGVVATSVVPDGGRVRITYRHDGQHKILDAAHVVMATPHPVTSQLVRGMPSDQLLAMEKIRVLPIVEVQVLLADGGPAPWDDLSAFWTMDKSFSVGVHSKTDLENRIGAGGSDKHSVIKLLAVGPSALPLADRGDEYIIQAFIEDLTDVFPEVRDKVRDHSIRRWIHGVPLPALGYDQHVAALIRPLGTIHFAGDWCGIVDTKNPGGVSLDGDWGGYTLTAALNAVMRAGIRAAAEIRGELV